METLAQLQAWLTAARTAYHQLMIGKSAVKVSVDGATFATEFTRANADQLQAYIARLEAKIERMQFGYRRGGAIGVIF